MTRTVTYEKIVGGGMALGYIDGKPCFSAGPLPGETAEVEIVKEKPGFIEANVTRITMPSKRRSLESEDHYLECSPWQNVEYEFQLELKRQMLEETFGRPELMLAVSEIVGAPSQLGYRNKLEFSVMNSLSRLDLAFHGRGSFEKLISLPEGCQLGSTLMNQAALELAKSAHSLRLGGYLDSLTIRQSISNGKLLGVLALHQIPKREFNDLDLGGLSGLVITRVRHRTAHEMIWHAGETSLHENLKGLDFEYSFDSFFQTNPAMFEVALERIEASVLKGSRVVDLYGGVGTIGLSVSNIAKSVVGVEISEVSTGFALANADRNGILNYSAISSKAERLDVNVIRPADCVIVDPPRAGLHLNLIRDLLEAEPARIIYLSCNPSTMARDVKLLSENYHASSVVGFDFYPGTLHVEALIVLDHI